MSESRVIETRRGDVVPPADLAGAGAKHGARLASSVTSYDAKAHTVDLVAATETRVDRGSFIEILQCAPGAVDLSRVAARQAPLLDSHTYGSIADQLGTVIGARFEGATLILTVRFSDTAAGREAEGRVASGDVCGVSVGYKTEERTQTGEAGGVPILTATRWQLLEVSLVSVPADAASGVRSHHIEVRDPHDREGMEDALAARMLGRVPTGRARQYRDYRIVDFIAARARVDVRSPLEILQRAAGTPNDVGIVLETALRKVLLASYQGVTPAYRKVAARKVFSDFRQHRFYRTSEFPALLSLAENSETYPGAFHAARESIGLVTRGRAITLSRQQIFNDDLNVFGQLAASAAKAALKAESAMFAALLSLNGGGGPTLSDGQPMFSAAHGNVAGAGAALSVTTLSAARTAMRRQTDLDGQPIEITPRTLYLAPEQEEAAEQIVGIVSPLTVGDGGALENRYDVAVDNHIPAGPWFMFADPVADSANFAYGFLNDAEGPQVVERGRFDTDGVTFRVTHDFGIGGIDFRYGYRNGGGA